MKTSIIEVDGDSKELFPAMYRSLLSGVVVLFSEKARGVTVYTKSGIHKVNGVSETWTPCDDKITWKRLPAGTQIVLTQE